MTYIGDNLKCYVKKTGNGHRLHPPATGDNLKCYVDKTGNSHRQHPPATGDNLKCYVEKTGNGHTCVLRRVIITLLSHAQFPKVVRL